jgi:glyoxylase-like metal-dependent hydrolase (beta-lactamase superfamily II)
MFRSFAGDLWLQASLLWQTQCAVMRSAGAVLVIDPGFLPHEIEAAKSLADEVAGAGADRYLVLSHSDFDHIVGVPYFPDWTIVASARWDRRNERRARAALRSFDGGYYIERERPLTDAVRPDREIRQDGEEIAGCLFYQLSGHTRDGLACYHPGSGALIVGDYLSDCEFPFIYVSALAYRETLAKLRRLADDLRPAMLVSQHGRPAVGRAAIERRLRESSDYLERLMAAAPAAASPAELERATLGAWRDGVPDPIRSYHRKNARIAWRELRP